MRRCLLSVLLAAAALAPAAGAVPLCYGARVESPAARPVDTGSHCVPYNFGAECRTEHVWVSPAADGYLAFCVPTLV